MKYVNHFMIQRRKREFPIQSIIGMEQSTIARLFIVESLIMGIFSLIVGIGVGGVFSQFITAMLL
ncbi:FtsX-like permease family protein, partial [Coprococcus eutactus]|uniref:FtsX-like permease family protein n=1 Tax=Coprococcus eutactus TaxID=33043 RepID=UPI00210ABA87